MPRVLSEQDLEFLATELAAGRPPMVWFTSRAVGVESGKSGKVTALDEPAEGEFIQVRPTGSQDVLSFSAGEVTLTKPARKPRKPDAPETPQAEESSAPAPIEPVWTPEPAPVPTSRGAKPRPSTENGDSVTEPTSNRRTGAAKRSKPGAAATITLNSTAEGLWTAEVTVGTKKVLKPTTVSMGAVAQAVKILHPEADAAVQPVLDAAREQQRAKVEQLQAELEEARRLLGDLDEPAATDENGDSDSKPASDSEASGSDA
ncbi:DUF6319 family protein [Actinoalloteichus hymeniacidonis]|uniref:Cell wall anchor protein n=1 Tax=Actinoalloteichus hymeniacidonis TaxID=340345 RepID=A0AAC9MWI1_9PSEU|nr:DUF6319 family protein [Actinoalloteichus hymeniacidonis]AOS62248.1 hypothetical protein TL08_07145 [Actinoalloteichus hymeniacidonis]MBB5909726.1 hypothetical protein [Actinoalloteichus hymeniacidonis]